MALALASVSLPIGIGGSATLSVTRRALPRFPVMGLIKGSVPFDFNRLTPGSSCPSPGTLLCHRDLQSCRPTAVPLFLLRNALALLHIHPHRWCTHDIANFRTGLVCNAGSGGIGVNSSAVKAGRARFAVNLFWARLGNLAVLAQASMRER